MNLADGLNLDLTEETDGSKLGYLEFKLNNTKKQFELPLTGGFGIFVYLLVGSAIGSFAIVLITRKGKEKNVK